MVVVTDFKLHKIDKEALTKSVSFKLHLDTNFMTIALSTVLTEILYLIRSKVSAVRLTLKILVYLDFRFVVSRQDSNAYHLRTLPYYILQHSTDQKYYLKIRRVGVNFQYLS